MEALWAARTRTRFMHVLTLRSWETRATNAETRATNAELQVKQLQRNLLAVHTEHSPGAAAAQQTLPPPSEAEAEQPKALAKIEAETGTQREARLQLASAFASMYVSELVMREEVSGLEEERQLSSRRREEAELQLTSQLQQAAVERELREQEQGECAVNAHSLL